MAKVPSVSWSLAFCAACMAMTTAQAGIPQSISYQGFLTDRFGAPVGDTPQIELSVYAAPAGGVPLWNVVQSVVSFQGLFSVELGSEQAPFPVGLFDKPLFLGIKVGSDSELVPRRPITTAAFSFRAEDADTVQGRLATDLDQSAHVNASGNPHGVTAAEAGTASEADLAALLTADGSSRTITSSRWGLPVFPNHPAITGVQNSYAGPVTMGIAHQK